jgi:transcriptional regulator with XRE-family HTH domain
MARRLRRLRGDHGLTQEDLCARLGILQEQYSKYETGKRLPYDQLLERLGDIYGITPEELAWGGRSPTAERVDPASVRRALNQGREVPKNELALALAQAAAGLERVELEDLFLEAVLKLEAGKQEQKELTEKKLAGRDQAGDSRKKMI